MSLRTGAVLLLALLAALMAAGADIRVPSPPALAGPVASVQGDVNCSETVDTVDGLEVLRSVAGLPLSADCLAGAGDVDCSGGIDTIDSLKLLRHVAGLANTPVDGCAAIGEPLAPEELPPTSEELIAVALEAGDIDYEASLLYRAYAAYGDPRLPDEYESPFIDLETLTSLASEVLNHQEQLSAQILNDLQPFLARPNDPISAFNAVAPSLEPAGAYTWLSTPAMGGAIRVGAAPTRLTRRSLTISCRRWNKLIHSSTTCG